MIIYVMLAVSLLCPLLIFFDYNKRSNIHWAIVYIVTMAVAVVSSRYLIPSIEAGLIISIALPVLLVISLFVLKKRKSTNEKKNVGGEVIDDF